MNHHMRRFAAPIAAAAMLTNFALAQQAPKDMTPEQQAEAAAKIQALAQPGPEHELLVASLAGRWSTVTTFEVPDQEPMEFRGGGVTTPILGGRFLKFETETETEADGQVFENLSIVGYDRRAEQFTFVGFDNAGTYYVEGTGVWDDGLGGIRFNGEVHDPVLDRMETYYFQLQIQDDDHHVWEIWFKQPDGEYSKFASVANTRIT